MNILTKLLFFAAVILFALPLDAQNRTSRSREVPPEALELPAGYRSMVRERFESFEKWITGKFSDPEETAEPQPDAKEKKDEDDKKAVLSSAEFRKNFYPVEVLLKNADSRGDLIEATGYPVEKCKEYYLAAEKLQKVIVRLDRAKAFRNLDRCTELMETFRKEVDSFKDIAKRNTWKKISSAEMKKIKSENRKRREKIWRMMEAQKAAERTTGDRKQ